MKHIEAFGRSGFVILRLLGCFLLSSWIKKRGCADIWDAFFYDTRKYVSWKGAALIYTYCCCDVCPFVNGILRKLEVEASNLKKIQYAAAHAPALCHQFMDPLYGTGTVGLAM